MNPNIGLPQGVTIRSAALSDQLDVLHVRQTQELADSGVSDTTAFRLAIEWEAQGPSLAEQHWVAVTADGSLLACAELVREGHELILRLWVLPPHRDRGLEMALLASAEQRACAIGRDEGAHSVSLFSQATDSHPAAQQALLQSGFVLSSAYEKMERTLDEPPPLPEVLGDIAIRPFAVGHDAERVYRADEEAFQDQRGHTPRSFEQWSERLNLRGEAFDPSLWRIAWDADDVAGGALGEVVGSIGWIHHLSVRRPWRHRGLGAALVLSALGAFYQQGIGAVRLNVDAQSWTNAHHLYRRLRFRVVGAYSNYVKIVPLV